MMYEAIVTTGSISGLVSLIGLLYVHFTKLGRMEIKICTLWRIYGEGVLEEAVRKGFASRLSPIVITHKGEDILGYKLKQKIREIVKKCRRNILFLKCSRCGCSEDVQHLVIDEVLDELKIMSIEKNIDINLLIATAILYTDKIYKENF